MRTVQKTTKTIEDTNIGTRETVEISEKLTAYEHGNQLLEDILSLPSTMEELGKQTCVCYLSGATLVRSTEVLIDFGSTGKLIASFPWVALVLIVCISLVNKKNTVGVIWRLIVFAFGGL